MLLQKQSQVFYNQVLGTQGEKNPDVSEDKVVISREKKSGNSWRMNYGHQVDVPPGPPCTIKYIKKKICINQSTQSKNS